MLDIVTIAVCAVISGAESWVEVAQWGRIKQAWLADWLDLPHGMPTHDTFGRVFARIDPAQFEAGFLRWVQTATQSAEPEVIALDGKTIRRSGDRRTGQRPLHLVSAWASERRLVLAQAAVDTKDNEITTLPSLLDRLDLTGQIVTIDAMGCQREIAGQIVGGGGDYVLALKANQPDLHEDVIDCFAMAEQADASARTVEKDHGRVEVRVCETIHDPAVIAWLDAEQRWPGLRTIARVAAIRQVGGQDPTTSVRYYLSSLPGDARPIAEAVRSHWGIENSLHWVLDMAFREDESRTRTGDSAQNLAVLRKLALTLIQQDRARTVGVKASRLRAGWDTGYLLALLGAS
ncbi:MAG: ISAs1 family transposase [Chloroflexota bacterium]|nr:ISAs1 family transposase [Chloroflexota bacterium]